MALISVINTIAAHHTTFLGDEAGESGGFLGWIRLERDDGQDAGYIYLTNTVVEGHLGGSAQSGGPYVVMSRPVGEAAMLLAVLARGRAMQIRYHGEEDGAGTGFLEDIGVAPDAGFVADVVARFGVTLG